MATPKFSDLGKACADLFSDDFNASANKLTLKSKAINGTNLKVEGTRSNKDGSVSGLIETKFSHKASGLNVKEKWTTGNVVATEVSRKNLLTPGTDLSLTTSFKPSTSGLDSIKLKSSLVRDQFAATLDTDFCKVSGSGVFSYNKFLFGASTNLKSTSVGVAFVEQDYSITSTVTDGRDVNIKLFHTPRATVQAGAEFGWSKTGATKLGVAGRLQLDDSAYVKAKVDNKLNLGLAYVQKLRPGVTMTLAANLVGNNLTSGGHNLGMSLSLDN
ncbi:hypothetical protein PTSG_09996 [Salpingoeca rosetta]|uniref:Voltage-dependent anion-selective channel protein 2 n=1 Tax=Salpingoeca rosetta (strain ATCC 50818 / BSB-021) TaxID=946362 RepID=F2UP73_SALR5|nr:uncharacterized protein PTSG_09996 [Salpingoeca rosetta]EGD79428.1 hypothetical protein PTSG_09996 [Salpingoeca rosetta]|eukprot:XP_004988909.1 hypothetical protein PTSG_09996 [Salpingoeca rosetta]